MSSDRIKELAERFLRAHNEFFNVVLSFSDTDWRIHCEVENETVAALFMHISLGYLLEIDLLRTGLSDVGFPEVYLSEDSLNRFHMKCSQVYASREKNETIVSLRKNGLEAYNYIKGLTDEDLEITIHTPLLLHWYGRTPSIENIIEHLLIGHHAMHFPSLQQAVLDGSQPAA